MHPSGKKGKRRNAAFAAKRDAFAGGKRQVMASSVEQAEIEYTGVADRKAIFAEHSGHNRPDFVENTAGFSEEKDASKEEQQKAAFGDDKAECESTRNQVNAAFAGQKDAFKQCCTRAENSR
jgi:hypothetical protein